MSVQYADNVSYKGMKFLDDRIPVATFAEIKGLPEYNYPDSFEILCLENKKWYVLDKSAEPTAELGKWSEKKISGGGAEYVSYTMTASNWVGNTYSFGDDYPFAQYNLELSPSDQTSASQLEQWSNAYIVGSVSSNVVTAKGEVPTDDIEVMLKVVSK